MNQEIAQIFIPLESIRTEGYLIGFNIRGLTFSVMFIESSHNIDKIEENLNRWNMQQRIEHICGAQLQILGRMNVGSKNLNDNDQLSRFETWINIELQNSGTVNNNDKIESMNVKQLLQKGLLKIEIDSLVICGLKQNANFQIILYHSLDSSQVITFQNYQLQEFFIHPKKHEFSDFDINILKFQKDPSFLNDYPSSYSNKKKNSFNEYDSNDKKEKIQQAITQVTAVEQINYIVRQINLKKSIESAYNQLYKSHEISPSFYHHFLQLKGHAFIKLVQFAILLIYLQRIVFLVAYSIFNIKIFYSHYRIKDLKLFNQTYNQLCHKIDIIDNIRPYFNLLKQSNENETLSNKVLQYLHFYQIIYHFIVDVFLGILSLLFLYYNIASILTFGHLYGSKIHIEVLSQEIEWLMGFPAGLKTNRNMNHFLGGLSLKIIEFWNGFTTFATPYEPILVRLVAISGLFGLTIEIAIISDFIELITLHMYELI